MNGIVRFPEVKNVCVVIASRANYGRLKSVIKAVKEHPRLNLQLVAGASALLSRFGNVKKIMQDDGFEIDAEVNFIMEGATPLTMAKSTGIGLMELPTIFNILKPDIVLTHADRFETISTAIAATYMNIPLAHTQGGELTGSIDESVRHAITKMSHIHFPATEMSRKRIISMGENPEFVFKTGCPSLDMISKTPEKIPADFFEQVGGTGEPLNPEKPYILVLQHPVTTEYGSGRLQITQTLMALQGLRMQTFMMWPNPDAGSEDVAKGIRIFREHNRNIKNMQFVKNLPVEDYALLLKNASCVIGNTSSGLREASFFGTPAVNIGSRQQLRERDKNVVDATYDYREIMKAARAQIEKRRYPSSSLYGDGKAGKKIAEILADIKEIPIQKQFVEQKSG